MAAITFIGSLNYMFIAKVDGLRVGSAAMSLVDRPNPLHACRQGHIGKCGHAILEINSYQTPVGEIDIAR